MPRVSQLHLAADHDDGDAFQRDWSRGPTPAEMEDLPYAVEVWDEQAVAPEHLVAITVSASLAYAAYYSAAREYFGREVTIKFKGHVMAQWRPRRN